MLPEPLSELSSLIRAVSDRELPSRFGSGRASRKPDGSLLTEADLVMQNALADQLTRRWPEFEFLGEEMNEAQQRQAFLKEPSGIWCIDPLDGTSNFALGVPYYGVSVALLRGDAVELGVVYDPSRRECFAAARGHGAWLNEQRLRPQHLEVPLSGGLALVDLKRLPRDLSARLAADPPYKSQRSFGAVSLDWCWLAAGRCHVYLHGRQKLWDYAAGFLVLQEAGGKALTLDGGPVFAPTLEPRSAAAALDPEVFAQWMEWLGVATAEG